MKEHSLYKLFKISPQSNLTDLKTAYRKMVKKYHPDVSRKNTHRQFSELHMAYKKLADILKDGSPERRCYNTPGPAERSKRRPAQNTGRRSAAKFNTWEIKMNTLKHYGNLYESSLSRRTKCHAIEQIGSLGLKTGYQWIRKALYEKDPMVVKTAVRAAGRLEIRQSVFELASLFSRSSSSLRLDILRSAQKIGHQAGLRNICAAGIYDNNPQVKSVCTNIINSMKKREKNAT